MAFVIQEDYVFVNEYLDDDNNDENDYNDEKNNEIINDDSQKILDKLINQTVNKFFYNKSIYYLNDIILLQNCIPKN